MGRVAERFDSEREIVSVVFSLSDGGKDAFLLRPGAEVVIGRGEEAHLVVDDTFVSRRHCRVELGPRGLRLIDLGSANGTLRNGVRVVEEAPLRDGDELEVGTIGLRVHVEPFASRERALAASPPSNPLVLKETPPEPTERRTALEARLAEEGYRVLERLVRRGPVALYTARKVAIEQVVVLRVLSIEGQLSQAALERFLRGVMAHALLRHPNVLGIQDVRERKDMLFAVLDHVPGDTLIERVRRRGGRLSIRELLLVAHQLGRALAHLQQHGVVHRDVKPANVMIGPDEVLQLIDFGVAQPIERAPAEGERAVVRHESIGTPGFMAPEQVGRAGYADTRSDLFGLGATLFYCLTGRALPDLSRRATTGRIPAGAPERPSSRAVLTPEARKQLATLAPPDVVALITKLTQPRPEDRFQSARELLAAIEQAVARHTGMPVRPDTVESLLRLGELPAPATPAPRDRSGARRASIHGLIQDEALGEVLQLLELGGKSGVLFVRSPQLDGRIEVRHGQIVRADAGPARDRDACVRLFALRRGSFAFENRPPNALGPARCELRISALLLDALRAADEVRHASGRHRRPAA